MKSNQLTDRELVSHYLKGNEACLQALVLRHKSQLFGFIKQKVKNHHLAEDIFQDTFIKVIIALKKNGYSEQGKFIAWVMRIARNLIMDYYREEKKLKTISGNNDFDIFDRLVLKEANIEESMIQIQIDSDLLKIVKKLSKEQREVIMLRHFKGKTFKEISEKKNISLNTALGRMRYALINLRKIIEENNIILS